MLRHDVVDEVMDVDLRLRIRRNCSPLGHVGMLRGREPDRRRREVVWFPRVQTHRWVIPLLKNHRPWRRSGAILAVPRVCFPY